MTLPARRLAPALAVVALGLSACGGDEPTPAPSSSAQSSTGSSGEGTTSSPGSSSSTASSRAQRELTQAELDAALPGKDEGPYPVDSDGVTFANAGKLRTEPAGCSAIYLDSPEARAFADEHRTARGGILYTEPRDQFSPQLSVRIISHDAPYPQEIFDAAGAAVGECATHDRALTEEDSLGEWEATSIPTQAIGDQAFGVRIGRPQFDAAVDYLWVRSGHNLINVRMVSGYSQDNDTRLGTYAQGVLDALD